MQTRSVQPLTSTMSSVREGMSFCASRRKAFLFRSLYSSPMDSAGLDSANLMKPMLNIESVTSRREKSQNL